VVPVSPAAEFPNDNPALHRGAIWVSEEPCAPLVAEPVDIRLAHMVEELVADLVDAPAPVPEPAPAPALTLDLSTEPTREAPLVADEEDDADEPIEIVDELEDFDIPEPAPSDPFSIFVRTLAEVALAAGGSDAAGSIPEALANESTARAWRSIINGESEDFAACGSKPLDEWAAELLARVVCAPAKADQLRRELRSRGVAAFGLVID
jgi:hypothetical protein